MNIMAYYMMHYGVEWLATSLSTICPKVDEVHIFYSDIPSFGQYAGKLRPPTETEEHLHNIVNSFSWAYTIQWHDITGQPGVQVDHRNYAVDTLAGLGADIVIAVDPDELWYGDVFDDALEFSIFHHIRKNKIGFRHFWRSTKWVCDDPGNGGHNVRIINLGGDAGELIIPSSIGKVYHMSYAQSRALVGYKRTTSSHAPEYRPGWFENIFCAWKPGVEFEHGVHPVGEDTWTPKPYADAGELASIARSHPYWGLDVIDDL